MKSYYDSILAKRRCAIDVIQILVKHTTRKDETS